MTFVLPPLPPSRDIESPEVLRRVAYAHRYLAELKGVSKSIPSAEILINTLSLQEAKDSSAIENIITTHDELYKESLFPELAASAATKEVSRYSAGLQSGFQLVRETGLLTSNHIISIQAQLEGNTAGFRRLAGTKLLNDLTGDIVYTPPQDYDSIVQLMTNLERYINDAEFSLADPLVKMAVIHYQFESIHPFYDGNGRTGRIINVLYLVLMGLLDIPVLYLSREIIRTKHEYYTGLQRVRTEDAWEDWIIYILGAVETTAKHTLELVTEITTAFTNCKRRIRKEFKFYSQDLIASLFKHPYTKIGQLQNDLGISRLTATKYLDALASGGILDKHKVGNSNYYVNFELFRILAYEEKE